MDLENRIQKYNSFFTTNDHKILDYILSNKSLAIHKPINALAAEISVSPASISRLCKKLNFDNFQQLKYSLAKSNTSINKTDDTPTIVSNYYETIINLTKQFITKKQVDRIISILSSARKVVFCGIGNSGVTASEFNSRTERMGINSQSITEPHTMLIKSTLMDRGDVLFCFSYTGRTQSVIDSARIAKERGCKIVVITNYGETELTKIADEVVLISSHIYIEDEKFVNTQIASLFFLDILTYKLFENDHYFKNRQETLKSINQFG